MRTRTGTPDAPVVVCYAENDAMGMGENWLVGHVFPDATPHFSVAGAVE